MFEANSKLSTQNSQLLSTRRDGANDVPAVCAAGVEKFFVIFSKLEGIHDVEGKYEGAELDRRSLN